MKIDGRKIAEQIRKNLKSEIIDLKSHDIVPKIAIITLGSEASWETYVRQKIKVAQELGIKTVLINLEDGDEEKLIQTVREIDSDPNYHGIIVQRPIPSNFNRERVVNAIAPEKDVDGFRSDSKFEVPVWLAVKRLLEESLQNTKYELLTIKLVVIGKGETAGGPIIRGLKTLGIEPQIVDSRTENRDKILKNADVIIPCVGRPNIVRSDNIKKGMILIGVGTHGEDERLRGDYKVEEIEQIAGVYTPTPGGVGPINLSYLFSNLVEAAKLQNPQV